MTRIVLTFGLISGAIAAGLMWLMLSLFSTGTVNFDNGEIFGYATMLIALSMIFFGIKSYRDNNGGRIGFWRGIQVGLLISLISAACYGISWEVYYQSSSGSFMQEYTEHYLEKMKQRGASPTEVEAAAKQMADIGEMYKNPVIRFAMTIMEILPVGIIVTFVSAALLRKREVLSAELA
jgi:hypothetical protein